MHRRHQSTNIPTEIIRTIVMIAEAGSFSKAGQGLGLSQSAISAQVKRLQYMVGGPIFQRITGGVSFTAKGKIILTQARRILEANDQILNIGGASNERRAIRLGLPTIYLEQFLKDWRVGDELTAQTIFFCDQSADLIKSFGDGYLDLACLVNFPDDVGECILSWQEEIIWVRSRNFVLRPGNPLPIIGFPGSWQDEMMINAIEKAGLAYRVMFTSIDHHARVLAAANGIGLMPFPRRFVGEPLMIASEYYLPELRYVRVGLFVRSGSDDAKITALVGKLRALSPSEARVSAAERESPRSVSPKTSVSLKTH